MSLIMDPIPPFSHSTSSSHGHHTAHTYRTGPPHTSHHPPPQSQYTAFHPVNNGGVQKRSGSQSRSASTSADPGKLQALLPESIRNELPISPTSRQNPSWTSPRTSPHPHPFFAPSPTTFRTPSWGPLPSRADSGVAGTQAQPTTSPVTSVAPHANVVPPAVMRDVHYAMPPQAQYGPLGIDESSIRGSNYHFAMSMQQPVVSQGYDFSQADSYGTSSMRTSSPTSIHQHYGDDYRLANAHDMHRGYNTESIPRPLAAPTLASNAPNYTPSSYQRSPSMYEGSVYGHAIPASQPMGAHMPPTTLGYGQPVYGSPSMAALPRSMSSVSTESMRGATSPRGRPQCFDHGCNGRRFSTFSNLLRHQREKSGTASKSYCPKCGAEFTRTTARNGHLAHDKCSKQRRNSTEDRS